MGLDPLPISALAQYAFCPRRAALMYLEHEFEDNAHTAAGTLSHEIVDDPGSNKRGLVSIEDALPIFSDRYGLVGKADRVEFYDNVPYPIEFKLGHRSRAQENLIQLCAQSLCLSEMFEVDVPEGAIYHTTTRKREVVIFSEELHKKTLSTIAAVQSLFTSRVTPPGKLEKKCDGCSLRRICVPELFDDGLTKRLRSAKVELWGID